MGDGDHFTISVEGRPTSPTLQNEQLDHQNHVGTAAVVTANLAESSVTAATGVTAVVSDTTAVVSDSSAAVSEPSTDRLDPRASTSAAGDYRNVAVQAPARYPRGKRDNTSKTSREPQVTPEVAPAEVWIGDVRALRDSHVRLVRRELRHIARLNRTLDNARNCSESKAAQPRGTVPKRSPRATHE
ncbi:hypothetical protein evm_003878 [Chilo suppressalis]|nr:hypothetical protein evm_003878 [Chilo suppressalis]